MNPDEKKILEEQIKSKLLRHSQPREKILEVFVKANKHLTVQELYFLVKKKYPDIGLATVYRALKLICETGLCREVRFEDGIARFVIPENYGYVELIQEGKELAHHMQKRHDILLKFLTEILKINSRIAESDACKMEHSVSPQTLQKITKFIEFAETCPDNDRPYWLESFDYYFKTGKQRKRKIRQIRQKVKIQKNFSIKKLDMSNIVKSTKQMKGGLK